MSLVPFLSTFPHQRVSPELILENLLYSMLYVNSFFQSFLPKNCSDIFFCKVQWLQFPWSAYLVPFLIWSPPRVSSLTSPLFFYLNLPETVCTESFLRSFLIAIFCYRMLDAIRNTIGLPKNNVLRTAYEILYI